MCSSQSFSRFNRAFVVTGASAVLFAGLGFPNSAHAADMLVPSDLFPTLPDAVADASINGDPLNTIYINGVVSIGATIHFDATFSADRELIIRPHDTLARATIEMLDPFTEAFFYDVCFNITLQDLDILRNTTNASDLIVMDKAENCVIERCRLGSIWTVPGTPGTHVLRIFYPKDIVIRNCIIFAYFPGTFDVGIHAQNFLDDDNSIFLYNNDVADYLVHGIQILEGAGANPDALVLLRNNVVSNHPDIAAEPTAYHSDIGSPVIIETSHNVALATAGFVEDIDFGAESISGETGVDFLRFARADIDDIFIDRTWVLIPAWDPNLDFFRLEPKGNPMHDAASDHGETVADGAPYFRDKAVRDDIEKDPRPGGEPPHTDRGADQLDPGIVSGVPDGPPDAGWLWAVPRSNPSRTPALLYAADGAGVLVAEIFDVAGRRVYFERRDVVQGEEGLIEWSRNVRSGALFYRLRLRGHDGRLSEVKGKMLVVR